MTARIESIWRYPIKAHGAERIGATDVTAGRTLPWDRVWAVAHEASRFDGSDWVHCANFTRGAKVASLMAITSRLDEASGRITLNHPDLGEAAFDPETDSDAFVAWVMPLMPADRAAPARLVSLPNRGMTDTPFPSIALIGASSLRALSGKVGRPLDRRRFRANFWIDGLGPWEEFEWVGRRIEIGGIPFDVEQRITRCLAIAANPETGRRDADPLGALEDGWGHTDIGVYLTAAGSGRIAEGDIVGLAA